MAVSLEQIIAALLKNGGWIKPTADILGISRQALEKRIKHNAKLKQVQLDIKAGYLDFAESKVIAAVNDNKTWAICFYLKCQGKERGWIEYQGHEVSGKGGEPIVSICKKPDYSKLSKADLKALHALSEKLYS